MAPDPLVRLQAVSKIFPGGIVGLDAIDLDIVRGEFITLLGPSVAARPPACVSSPASKALKRQGVLDGRDITALRPFDRPVNTVFQDYALFPHMNVAENVGGCRCESSSGASSQTRRRSPGHGRPRRQARARVSELSGGQRQRVALARAMVFSANHVCCCSTSRCSALDAHLREQMQVELKRLQSRLGTTFVMVTHDQTEALSISDRIVVMNKGRIEQIARRQPFMIGPRPSSGEFHRYDESPAVAFVGRDGDRLRSPRRRAAVGGQLETGQSPGEGEVGEHRCAPGGLAGAAEAAARHRPARVNSIVFHGRTLRLHAELGQGMPVVIDAPRQAEGFQFSVGDVAHISLRRGAKCPMLSA